MIKYQRNNILFRIASADAIAKFKEAQAHSFLQISRKELSFDVAAKEVVLLEFDRFSHLIFRIERICVAAGEGPMKHDLARSILDSFHEELRVIETVIERHNDVFTKDVIQFTKLIHDYTSKMLDNSLVPILATSIDEAFAKTVMIISHYLQHLLIAMHEFNSSIVKHVTSPFLSVGDFCIDFLNYNEKFTPCVQRGKFFKDRGVGDTYILKNYSQCDIFDDVRSCLQDLGITLIPEDMISQIAISS